MYTALPPIKLSDVAPNDAHVTHVAVPAHVMLQVRSIFSNYPLNLQVTGVQHHAADAVFRRLQSDLHAASTKVR